jgi:hypothetical protein
MDVNYDEVDDIMNGKSFSVTTEDGYEVDVIEVEDAILEAKEFAEYFAEAKVTEALTLVQEELEKNEQLQKTFKGENMYDGIKGVASEVTDETKVNSAIITGEALLDNIETLAERLVFDKMPRWKKWLMSKEDKEIAVTGAVYVIIYAIKSGGFGLTKYRINHELIDYVTLAANKRIIKFIMRKLGVDFNIAKALLKAPTITKED